MLSHPTLHIPHLTHVTTRDAYEKIVQMIGSVQLEELKPWGVVEHALGMLFHCGELNFLLFGQIV